MSMECQLLEQPAQPALVIRRRTPFFRLPKVLGDAYEALEKYLAELGEQPADAPFAAYHNKNMFSLDISIGFPVRHALPGRGEIRPEEIPAGKAAACLHTGPYKNIGPVYRALGKWIQTRGLTESGTAYEYYLNDTAVTPQAEWMTKVVFPLI